MGGRKYTGRFSMGPDETRQEEHGLTPETRREAMGRQDREEEKAVPSLNTVGNDSGNTAENPGNNILPVQGNLGLER